MSLRLSPSSLAALLWASVGAAVQAEPVSPAWAGVQVQAVWYGVAPVVLAGLAWLGWFAYQFLGQSESLVQKPTLQFVIKPVLVALVALLLGLGLSSHLVQRNQADLHTTALMRFYQQVDHLEVAMHSDLDALYGMLRSVRATVVTNPTLSRDMFRDWVMSRQFGAELAGVRGLGVIDKVSRAELPAYIARQRINGAPDFAVRSTGNAPDLFIIKTVEPVAKNLSEPGFDVASETVLRAAAKRSMLDGMPALSAPITLLQNTVKRSGFLFLTPIYDQITVPATPDERVKSLRGWAYAPIVAAEFLERSRASSQDQVAFKLFKTDTDGVASLIYDSDDPTGIAAPEITDFHTKALFLDKRSVLLGGEVFQLRSSSAAGFERSVDVMEPARMAFAGSSLSVLLSLVIWLVVVGRARATALAGRMTRDIQQLSMVAQRTSNAVIITDTDQRITWVNEGFTRITGYSLSEVAGKRPGAVLQCPATAPETIRTIGQDVRARKHGRYTILNRSKEGREYWLDIEIQPIYTDAGEFMGFMAVESDITEMRHTRDALVAEKLRMDNILSGTNVGTWEWNAQSKAFKVNERFVAMIGFELADAQPDVWSFWKSRTHPADWIRSHNELILVLRGQQDLYSCDTRIQRKDGSWMWVSSRGRVMSRTPDGRAEWLAGIHTDVSEIKRNEEMLRDAEIFLERAGRTAGVGAWQVDLKTAEISWNDQTCEIHGVEPGFKPTMQEALAFYPGPAAAQVQAAIEQATAQCTSWDLTLPFITANGDALWVRSVGEGEFDDSGAVRLLGAFQDVTRAYQSQLALQETTVQAQATSTTLQSVLDAALDVAIIATDLNQTITLFNKGAERLLGYAADELVGKHSCRQFFEPGRLGLVGKTLALSLGRQPSSQELFDEIVNNTQDSHWIFVRKDSSHVNVSFMISPVRSPQGAVTGYLGIAQDITQQQVYEDSLRQAKRAAEQNSVAKSQFLANMSHEIRTPMNAILGMLTLLHNTPLSERQRDYTDKTESAAKSLLVLLNDILDFSKVEAGKLQMDPHPFLIEQLLTDLSVILSSNLGGKNLDVLFDVDPAIPAALVGDALRIKQILINLGGNAVKFTAQGQVVIQLRLVALHLGRAHIEFVVRDTGIGIAPENQARIFEGFSQAEASTTRKFGGTGLGLAISQRLIGLMGGELQLVSSLGQGSTFSFGLNLPVSDVAASQVQATEAGTHMLLVDDNPQALATCAAQMESLGWQVTQASSGPAALKHIGLTLRGAATALSALYVDWHMPGMDGWQTLQEARRLYGERPAPLMVMLSGQGREMLAQRSAREQDLLHGFLVKPLTVTMLHDAYNHHAAVTPLAPVTPAKRLEGMRILVVEDNLINQQVASELLGNEGAFVSLADNGRMGVDAVASAQPPFDVVLMDLQMPVMDGLSAAIAIRTELELHALPIIAMTANAMASDRQACLQAGMNDHVGKPFDLLQLIATLVRFTHWSTAPADAVNVPLPSAPTPQPGPAINWPPGMDGALALARMGGNAALFGKTLRAFGQDAPHMPSRVEALVQAAEVGAAQRELHAFKGLAATLGLMELSAVAAQAEKLTIDQQTAQLGELSGLLVQIGQRLDSLLPELIALASQLAPPNATQHADASAIPPLGLDQLRELLNALLADDMAAMEMHATMQQSCGGAWSENMAALDAAMAEMDFVLAAAECKTLLDHPNP